MPDYHFNSNDDDRAVLAGASSEAVLACTGIIGRDDGYGGYNVRFSISPAGASKTTGSAMTGEYHVHFNGNPPAIKGVEYPGQVNVVRYKLSSTDAGGSNLIKFNTGKRKNLKALAGDCAGYPNHVLLLTRLSDAWAEWKKAP